MLENKNILITGGARGIGRGIAQACLDAGASVAIIDIDKMSVEKTMKELKTVGGQLLIGEEVDVANEKNVESVFEKVNREIGGLDGVVINAGILHLQYVEKLELADWNRVLSINLTGAFLCARESVRLLRGKNLDSSIVFTSSLFGLRGGRENGAYSASKFGVIGLAQSLAAEVAADGIRVNSVCPGQIETEMMTKLVSDRVALTAKSPEEVIADLVSHIPSKKMGSIAEVADAFVYLLSNKSRYITGQSLVVDGGWQVG